MARSIRTGYSEAPDRIRLDATIANAKTAANRGAEHGLRSDHAACCAGNPSGQVFPVTCFGVALALN